MGALEIRVSVWLHEVFARQTVTGVDIEKSPVHENSNTVPDWQKPSGRHALILTTALLTDIGGQIFSVKMHISMLVHEIKAKIFINCKFINN